MTLDDAVTTLWLIKGHWPNFAVLDGNKQALQAGAMLDVINDLDLGDVRAALVRLDVDGRDFPPTPGQIRDAVLAARGVTAPDWDQALADVTAAVRAGRGSQFSYDRHEPLHPVIEETVKAMGGWFAIGQSDGGETWRAQFRDAYKLAAGRHDREAKAPPMLRELAAGLAARLALNPAMTDRTDGETA